MDTHADAVREPAPSDTVRDVPTTPDGASPSAPAPSAAAPSARPVRTTKRSARGGRPVPPAEQTEQARPLPRRPVTVTPAVATAADVVDGGDHAEPVTYDDASDDAPDLLQAGERLREEVSALKLPLVVPDVETARTDRERLLAQLDDYLLPRLRRMDAPLLGVIGGSTGAGKSTLTNSLVRKEVSRSGVLRPTTRSPVLVHHPYDSGAFLSQRILPNLARVTAEAPEPLQPIDVDAPRITALRLVPHEGVPAGIALIDAPDIDSVVDTNRELAVQLLAAADLWLFVTTAARYGDAMPWEMLRQAVDRGASVAVILDRVPPESLREVRLHLATLLRDRGLASSPMFTIPETRTVDGLLPPDVVAPLLGWLRRLAKDARSRDVIVRRTLAGALDSLRDRVHVVAAGADAQRDADAALRADVDVTFTEVGAEVATRLGDGTVLRGEVLARWQEFVGTGEFARSLEANLGGLTSRLTASLRGRVVPSEPLAAALHTGVHAVVRAAAQSARERTVLRWRGSGAGAALLTAVGGATATLAPDFDARLARTVTEWQEQVLGLVRGESQGRRTTARSLSLGVDGTGAILMLASVAPAVVTDGAGEDVAAGAADLSRRILEAVFGDPAAGALTAAAHDDLVTRTGTLLASEQQRLVGLLDAASVLPDAGDRLRAAVRAVEEAR